MKEHLLGTSEEGFFTEIHEDICADVISASKAWNHNNHLIILKETRGGQAQHTPQPLPKGPSTIYTVNITG